MTDAAEDIMGDIPVSSTAEVKMSEDILWNKFAESGSIEDYLQYSAHKEDNHDNC